MNFLNIGVVETPERIGIQLAASWQSRVRGILQLPQSSQVGMVLFPCRWIHTFSLRAPIDVYFIDASGHILSILHNVAPQRFAIGPQATKLVLEVYSHHRAIQTWKPAMSLCKESLHKIPVLAKKIGKP